MKLLLLLQVPTSQIVMVQLVSLNFLILGGQFQIQKINIVLLIILVAIQNDNKLRFLREMAAWLKRWDNSKIPNCDKLLSTQTSSFLQRTRSSHPKVYLRKGVLKICYRFTGKHQCRSAISIKLQSNFIEITFRDGCFPVNFCIFSEHHFLGKPLGGCF